MDKAKIGAWFVGAAGTMLIVGGLAWFIIQRTQPVGVDVARAQLRAQYLVEIQAENAKAIHSFAEIDKNRGIWRIPVEQAVEMTLRLWQDPAAGRADLLARLATATAKLPEKANEYE
ncbi:MAG: hypothetical protein ACYDC1_01455 [Limisphaerales bacterium]